MNALRLTQEQIEHVWKLLERTTGDCVDECPVTGEVWQYMGSFEESPGVELHQFRHRNLNRPWWKNPKRAYVNIRRFTRALPNGSWNAETFYQDYETGKQERLHDLDSLGQW